MSEAKYNKYMGEVVKKNKKKTPHFLEDLKAGGLHKALGVPADQPIPMSKLMEHKDSPNEHMRKMVQFALNAKKFKH